MGPLKFFVKAVVTGFGLALGAALFKKAGKQVGLVEDDKPTARPNPDVPPNDPHLQVQPN
jgi:hypothetical protein